VASASDKVIGRLTYGSQFLKTCSSRPYFASGVHWMDEYGESRCSCIAASAVTGFQTEPGG